MTVSVPSFMTIASSTLTVSVAERTVMVFPSASLEASYALVPLNSAVNLYLFVAPSVISYAGKVISRVASPSTTVTFPIAAPVPVAVVFPVVTSYLLNVTLPPFILFVPSLTVAVSFTVEPSKASPLF